MAFITNFLSLGFPQSFFLFPPLPPPLPLPSFFTSTSFQVPTIALRYVPRFSIRCQSATMVHLHSVQSDEAANASPLPGLEEIKAEMTSDDEVNSTIYGSRFAAQELPRNEIPEREMPKEVAYRLIKDDLALDGNPVLNLASFVTTYMVDDESVITWSGCPAKNHGRKMRPRS